MRYYMMPKVTHEDSYFLLTGSIPRGYGPLKTPVTFGSRERNLFSLIFVALLDTNKQCV